MFTGGDQVVAVLTASPLGCSFTVQFLESGLAAQSGGRPTGVVTAVEDTHAVLRTRGYFKTHGYLHLIDVGSPFGLFGPTVTGTDATATTTTYIQAVMERDKRMSEDLLCAHTCLQTPHKCHQPGTWVSKLCSPMYRYGNWLEMGPEKGPGIRKLDAEIFCLYAPIPPQRMNRAQANPLIKWGGAQHLSNRLFHYDGGTCKN